MAPADDHGEHGHPTVLPRAAGGSGRARHVRSKHHADDGVNRHLRFHSTSGPGSRVLDPALWFLWTRLGETPSDTFFGLWLRVLITLNALSLVIDTADVIRYIAGEREETVKGLT